MEKQRQTTPNILLVTNHIPSNVIVKNWHIFTDEVLLTSRAALRDFWPERHTAGSFYWLGHPRRLSPCSALLARVMQTPVLARVSLSRRVVVFSFSACNVGEVLAAGPTLKQGSIWNDTKKKIYIYMYEIHKREWSDSCAMMWDYMHTIWHLSSLSKQLALW